MAAPGRLAVGCDLGGTRLKSVLLSGDEPLWHATAAVPSGGAEAVVDLITTAIRDALARVPSRSQAPVVGVAVPGLLDRRRRGIVHLNNLPELDGLPLAARLKRRLGRRVSGAVLLDADSNAGAWGETCLGAGRGAKRVLYLSLGTGLGAAFVTDGTLVRTANHTVGQVGHLPLEPGGLRCSCGARGCAEATLSAGGIVKRARKLGLAARERADPAAIYLAAASGNHRAGRLFNEIGKLLGDLMATLTNFLSAERIVVGGGIARAADRLLPVARKQLERRIHPRFRGQIVVEPADLGDYAGATGIALLARSASRRPNTASR